MPRTLWDPLQSMPQKREFELYHLHSDARFFMGDFHVHDYYEFYFYLKGNVKIAVEEKLYTPEPYALFIYPPGIMHRCIPQAGMDYYERAYACVTRECLEKMSADEFPMLSILEEATRQHTYSFRIGSHKGMSIISGFDEIIQTVVLEAPADQMINRCRVNMLLASVCRMINPAEAEIMVIPNRMREVIIYINEHLTEPLTLESLAQQFYVSRYYLLHSFKEYTNLSVHQYIISKRIIHAQTLIREGMSLGEAARACGFNDYAGFYRAFVKQAGVTPQTFLKGGQDRVKKSKPRD